MKLSVPSVNAGYSGWFPNFYQSVASLPTHKTLETSSTLFFSLYYYYYYSMFSRAVMHKEADVKLGRKSYTGHVTYLEPAVDYVFFLFLFLVRQ